MAVGDDVNDASDSSGWELEQPDRSMDAHSKSAALERMDAACVCEYFIVYARTFYYRADAMSMIYFSGLATRRFSDYEARIQNRLLQGNAWIFQTRLQIGPGQAAHFLQGLNNRCYCRHLVDGFINAVAADEADIIGNANS